MEKWVVLRPLKHYPCWGREVVVDAGVVLRRAWAGRRPRQTACGRIRVIVLLGARRCAEVREERKFVIQMSIHLTIVVESRRWRQMVRPKRAFIIAGKRVILFMKACLCLRLGEIVLELA